MQETTQHNTAILIFANSATRELVQKPFVKDSHLFEELTKQTLLKVRKTKLPYFHSTEKQQVGTTFGKRFTHAIQQVYNSGYTNVIVIGNDSPQLKTTHLLEAAKQLQLGKTVLGPTFDGGFYLLGIHKSNFNLELFKKLPWQSFSLCHSISQLFKTSNLGLFRLPVLTDIDSKKDILNLLNHTKTLSKAILLLLVNLLIETKSSVFQKTKRYSSIFSPAFLNKGSPFLQIV